MSPCLWSAAPAQRPDRAHRTASTWALQFWGSEASNMEHFRSMLINGKITKAQIKEFFKRVKKYLIGDIL